MDSATLNLSTAAVWNAIMAWREPHGLERNRPDSGSHAILRMAHQAAFQQLAQARSDLRERHRAVPKDPNDPRRRPYFRRPQVVASVAEMLSLQTARRPLLPAVITLLPETAGKRTELPNGRAHEFVPVSLRFAGRPATTALLMDRIPPSSAYDTWHMPLADLRPGLAFLALVMQSQSSDDGSLLPGWEVFDQREHPCGLVALDRAIVHSGTQAAWAFMESLYRPEYWKSVRRSAEGDQEHLQRLSVYATGDGEPLEALLIDLDAFAGKRLTAPRTRLGRELLAISASKAAAGQRR